MIQPNYSPKEALKRAKLMMGYDPSTTLTENQERLKSLIKEDSIDTATEQSISKILKACSGRPEAEGTLDAAAIASAFNRAFNYQTLGFMGGTDDSLWRKQAATMNAGNFDDLCNIKKEFEDLGYGDFAQALVDDLDDEELAELMETFAAMQYRTKKQTKLAVASTEQYNINWFKKSFPCIFDSDSNVNQVVNKNANNYVYILIKGTSGSQYQVYSDGRVKKADGTSTGQKVSCNGSKVTLVAESIQKKKLTEQFDDSSLTGGNTGGGGGGNTPTPNPKPKPKVTYTDCSGTYKLYCKSPMIKKVQACLGLTDDGAWGKATNTKLKELGYTTFKDADVDAICEKAKPEISGEVVVTDPSSTDF